MPTFSPLSDFEATKRVGNLASDFAAFAFKGNLIVLAVGVILGNAFSKLVDSLVNHVVMPLIGLVMPGEHGYIGWTLTIGQKEVPFGQFLGAMVNFLIIALVLYLFVVKFLGKPSQPPPSVSKEEQLLTEIRDLLRQGSTGENAVDPSRGSS